jgi:hypothetical protein
MAIGQSAGDIEGGPRIDQVANPATQGSEPIECVAGRGERDPCPAGRRRADGKARPVWTIDVGLDSEHPPLRLDVVANLPPNQPSTSAEAPAVRARPLSRRRRASGREPKSTEYARSLTQRAVEVGVSVAPAVANIAAEVEPVQLWVGG